MTEVTNAYLPANRVVEACDAVLHNIADARHEILLGMARKNRRLFPWPRWRLKTLLRKLSPEERNIARLHRALEEAAVSQILDLAKAAACDNPEFRVQVSAADFRYLRDDYPMEDS